LRLLDAVAYEIGWTVLHIVAWIGGCLVVVDVGKARERFPRQASNLVMYIRVVALTLWGVVAAGMFAASVAIQVRGRDELGAVIAAGIGVVLYVTWQWLAWPVLRRDLWPPRDVS